MGALAQPHGGEGYRGSVVASGGGYNSYCWGFAAEEVGECAACFEGAGVLQEFQLEEDLFGRQAEVFGLDFQGRGFASGVLAARARAPAHVHIFPHGLGRLMPV